jgi:hypothetical protein
VAEPPLPWTLTRFGEFFKVWVEMDSPTIERQRKVRDWAYVLQVNPYAVGAREPGFMNMWHAAIPDSRGPDGRFVTCTYWTFDKTRIIRCDMIVSLSPPPYPKGYPT